MKVLKNIRQKHSNRLVIAQLNINSIRNKFTSLPNMIKDSIDILLISETKIDSSFPTVQFHIDGYTIHRRDRNENGGGLLLYVREDVRNRNRFRNRGFLCRIKCKKKEVAIMLLI